ncbi:MULTISPECIES: urease accessory protein UreD [Pseudomonas syringae group genomosp. 2]|uniref:Urease accessory protein UreD n=1 Tax=Pseudomonas amygdali pv. mori TaxID=34065 RepID=A0A3M4KTG4_PSEA0|nr:MULTISPECIES: urease accessory protein UreD [Pseudomonas syringae group genomosp. 2]RMQ32518.1 Urease accessory protein UreD [Pseudomonas amygdali pv. mori]RMR43241.1 Urease accessory protein UreD [Pseudomonas amygdali pv. mori]RMT17427.1 Urease accessory protein UreD [Pseudomonas amygdali pv. mori]
MNAHQTLLPVQAKTTAHIAFSKAPSGASYVSRQEVGYPFHLGRTLTLPQDPPGMAAVYLQSCSGGLFAGEALHLHLHAGPGTQVHVSTGAATVAHSMLERSAQQSVTLVAKPGALLEYLPMATILFPQTQLHSLVNVTLHPDARVMLCDAFCLHTPQGSEGLPGFYRADLQIHCPAGKLLAGDRLAMTGADLQRRLPGVSGQLQALATFMLVGQGLPVEDLKRALRDALCIVSESYLGVSALPNDCGVSVRIMTADAVALRNALHLAWACARQQLTGIAPRARRK